MQDRRIYHAISLSICPSARATASYQHTLQ
jgi:hypothetical protein